MTNLVQQLGQMSLLRAHFLLVAVGAGADPHAPTPFGKSAHELAVINNRAEALVLFERWGGAEAQSGGDAKRAKR